MSHNLVYVTPDATVRTAVELLRAHQMDVLPVLHEEQVVGLIDAFTLTLYDGGVLVGEAQQEPPLTVNAETPLPEAARDMRSRKLRQVPVVQEGRLIGTLSVRDLLAVWGSVNDQLTGLPVQHQLRQWISLNLSGGREVAIVFIDVDNFGLLNKQQGHVFGDQVLRAIARMLRAVTDPELDFVCRYGGDEFAVGSIRRPGSVQELAEQVTTEISRLAIDDRPAGVSASVGIAGGRRHRPRPSAHVEATLDDLITRASTASTAAKEIPGHICDFRSLNSDGGVPPAEEGPDPPPAAAGSLPRVVVEGYRIGNLGQQVEVSVALRSGERRHEAHFTAADVEVTQALVTATARCLEVFARFPVNIEVEETYEFTTPHGLQCVGATVALAQDGGTEHLVGSSLIRGDLYRTYINSVLDAANRRVTRRAVD